MAEDQLTVSVMENKMKRITLLLALVLCVSLGLAQDFVTVTPAISTEAVDSCTVTAGNDTVTAPTASFANLYAGLSVYGPMIPEGTQILATDSSTYVVLSETPADDDVTVLNFGVVALYTTYADGDWFGLPFRILYNPGMGDTRTLNSIVITDNSDQLGNTEVMLFNAFSDTLGQDSSAMAIVASEAHKVIGYIALTSAVDLGTGRVLTSKDIALTVPKGGLWGRMVAGAAFVPTAVDNIKIRFGFGR